MKNRLPEVVKQFSLRKYGEDIKWNDNASVDEQLNQLLEIVNHQHKQIVNLCTDLKWAVSDLPPLQEAFKKLYDNVHGIESKG